jgi:surface antigen
VWLQIAQIARAVATAVLVAYLGGCASMGLPFGPDVASASRERTSAVARVDAVGMVDPSDWETVRRTVAGVPATTAALRMEWANPDTGSTGIVGTRAVAADRKGPLCRPFTTTLSDDRGVHHYRGEACRMTDGRWQLFGVRADDALVS